MRIWDWWGVLAEGVDSPVDAKGGFRRSAVGGATTGAAHELGAVGQRAGLGSCARSAFPFALFDEGLGHQEGSRI